MAVISGDWGSMEKVTVIVGLVASCRSGFEMNGAGDKDRYLYVARATNQRFYYDILTAVSFTGRRPRVGTARMEPRQAQNG